MCSGRRSGCAATCWSASGMKSRRRSAAGKKAFLVNRVGDFGFALGLFLIWTTYGTLDFHDTHAADGAACWLGVLGSAQTRLPIPDGGGTSAAAVGHGDLPVAVGRSLRQECPVSAARLAARRNGRPDARQRADSRGDDGHGRRLYGRPAARRCLSLRREPARRGPDRLLHGPLGRR